MFRAELLRVVDFWLTRGLDRVHGGYHNCISDSGEVWDDRKSIWMQGRHIWIFATLFRELEPRAEWLSAARHGVEFVARHGFAPDGSCRGVVRGDGSPGERGRELPSDIFVAEGYAAFARASGEPGWLDPARALFRERARRWRSPAPGALRGHGEPMFALRVATALRAAAPDPEYDAIVRACASEILDRFVDPARRALLETVGPGFEFLDTPEGREINPGHAIESAWFMLEGLGEAATEEDTRRILDMIRWSMAWGWDAEGGGGLIAHADAAGKKSFRKDATVKYWWPHTEALVALLWAWRISGDGWFCEWFERVREYAFRTFSDPVHGGWFSSVRRDQTRTESPKGNLMKGGYHTVRALLYCLRMLEGKPPGGD